MSTAVDIVVREDRASGAVRAVASCSADLAAPASPCAEISGGGALLAVSAPSAPCRLSASEADLAGTGASTPACASATQSFAYFAFDDPFLRRDENIPAARAVAPERRRSHAPAWCALQVTPGHERATARRAARVARDVLTDSFVLYRQAMRRREGAWRVCDEVMFPGYVFLVTDDPAALAERLGLLNAPVRLVGEGAAPATLDDEEVAFVRDFGGAAHTVAMSVGDIVNGRLAVSEGPLAGREHLVVKIDRHRRVALLNVRTRALGEGAVRVGLEVVSKS